MALKLNKEILTKHQEQSRSNKEFTLLLDEEQNLKSLALILEKDYNIIVAKDGMEALEKISALDSSQEIHLIIADQRMPRLTALASSQTKELLPDAVRILLTGFSETLTP